MNKAYIRRTLKGFAFTGAAMGLTATAGLGAEGFRPQGFHFYKKVSGPAQSGAVYGRLALDQDVIAHSGGYDLVMSRDGVEIPSFTRAVPPEPGRSGTRKAQIIYSRSSRGLRVILIKLPEIPEGAQYTSIKLRGTRLFEASVYLSGGRTPDALRGLGSHNIYRYGGHRVETVRFAGGANRFFKLEISGAIRKAKFTVVSARFTDRRRVSEFKTSAKLDDLRRSRNSDNNASLYYFDNEKRNKIHRLAFTFKEKRYNRQVRIYQRARPNKSYRNVARLRIARRGTEKEKEGRQLVDLPYPISGALKIEILNGDDEPLSPMAFEAWSPREEIVFRVPAEAGGDLRLYYGNRYLTPRSYDIRETYNTKSVHVKYTAGAHTKNEDFSYSVLEPPLSSWIIRILFWLGLLALAFPAFKVFTSYAKAMTEARAKTAE